MIACKHCATPNSLDSAFCRRCGTSLPPDEVAVAREKNEALIAEGLRMFNDGRTAEAMAVAETAHEIDPSSATALSLRGMVHERRGEIAEALECYERILDLNPDSTLDRIKLNQLRNALANRVEEAAPDRRIALAAAIGAGLLVIGLGGLIAFYTNKPAPVVAEKEPAPLIQRFPGTQTPTTDPNQASPGATDLNQTPPNQGQPRPDDVRAEGTLPQATPNGQIGDGARADRPFRNQQLPNVPSGPLPNPTNGSGSNNSGFTPLDPNQAAIEINPRELPSNPPENPNRGPDPDPSPNRTGGNNQGSTTETPDAPPPVMEMSVRQGPRTGGNRTSGGAVENPGATGVQAMIRTANAQFEVGSYSQAATTYERALRSGADPGSTNQRLGQAYERLGRRNDAIIAYDRAAQALEAQIASGRASERTRNALESVKAARRALGGG